VINGVTEKVGPNIILSDNFSLAMKQGLQNNYKMPVQYCLYYTYGPGLFEHFSR